MNSLKLFGSFTIEQVNCFFNCGEIMCKNIFILATFVLVCSLGFSKELSLLRKQYYSTYHVGKVTFTDGSKHLIIFRLIGNDYEGKPDQYYVANSPETSFSMSKPTVNDVEIFIDNERSSLTRGYLKIVKKNNPGKYFYSIELFKKRLTTKRQKPTGVINFPVSLVKEDSLNVKKNKLIVRLEGKQLKGKLNGKKMKSLRVHLFPYKFVQKQESAFTYDL